MYEGFKYIYLDGMGVILEVNKPLSYYFSKELGITEKSFHKYEMQAINMLTPEMNEKFWHLSTLEEEIEYSKEFNKIFLENIGRDFDDELLEKLTTYRVKPDVKLKEGIHAALEKLVMKYKLGVLTNAMPSRKYYELTIDGIDKYFNQILISREIGHHKPDPIIYQEAIKRAGIEPERMLFVDDKVKYLDGAISAGFGGGILMGTKETSDNYPQVDTFQELVTLILSGYRGIASE